MATWNLLVTVCLAYVAFLFAIAFWAERRAAQGRLGWLRSPYVYTLSLSVYCTAWTFYGAVGSAARGGLEFLPIYLGPTLVFVGWFFLLRKLIRIGRTQRITSIADLISSRYGKSPALGVAVTLLAVVAATPYIALQLKSMTLSFATFATHDAAGAPGMGAEIIALWVAAGLAAFTILFGTRNIDANERHHGVVSAIAVEAIVKLAALLAVGAFVVWGLFPGPAAVFEAMPERLAAVEAIFTPRWVTLTFLSACAIVCLPRMFQVLVVENSDERHLATAAWAFPLYLALVSLFVLPIAIGGLATAPEGANPDLFVLTVPLAAGRDGLALLAFLGGFSAATSMVIVAAIALSTMVSNHIVIPLWLHWSRGRGDLRAVLLLSRRISIGAILALGYVYFLVSAPNALAAIGLIAFAGMAQVAPALIGALYWRGATRAGALAGLAAGFALWAYTLFLPSFEGSLLMSASAIAEGPFGIAALRPRALLGLEGLDPLVHSVFWSLFANVSAFVAVSLATVPRPLEQFQASQFIDVFRQSGAGPGLVERSATSEDLLLLASRILGPEHAQTLFAEAARAQGKAEGLPEPSDRFIEMLERELAGSVGAASAHELVSQTAGRGAVSVDGLMRIADETLQLIDAKRRLEQKSRELEETAAQLRHANEQLKRMDALKDAFLSQVSHELRTPMTSIRSFAEILGDMEDIDSETARRFLGIIREESQRLTRLLDEILDLSFLESGRVTFHVAPVRLADVIDRALGSTEGLLTASGVPVTRAYAGSDVVVETDFDRVAQVIINLISNSVKYGRGDDPGIAISIGETEDGVHVDVADRGPGIAPEKREEIFEKFARLGEANLAGSAGLGLPISREIMRNLGGDIAVLPNDPGAVFRVSLPRRAARAAAAE